ncbi:hypothetical protein BDV93DRAFT_540469 [Ceratobasidium sp. AG-I]|nr:hypothetical protein BDV93DRAFT_540469 [Ceratobasidium sp. AG-I]
MSRRYSPNDYVGLACLDVGAGAGGSVPMLARATVIDYRGNQIFDAFVKPTQEVVTYKTSSTGIKAEHLDTDSALPFELVQAKVSELIKDKIIVGHTLWMSLAVLGISHLSSNTRDVALYLPFRVAMHQQNQMIGLPTLGKSLLEHVVYYRVWNFMRRRTQAGFSNSLEDARASVDLYRSVEDSWEKFVFEGDWPCALPPPQYSQYFQ